jgi:fatty acid desaturase
MICAAAMILAVGNLLMRHMSDGGYARVEAPTWALIFIIYGGWLALTWYWTWLPLWAVSPLGAWLCAWHMSLQHELIHGHPTRHERVNGALASPPLSLWLPFALYREAHLRHHRAEYLTDPLEDPESTYMTPQDWAGAPRARRWVQSVCNTAVGRVLAGPPRAMLAFWMQQAALVHGGAAPWRAWLGHAVGVSLVLAWVCGVCHVSAAAYAACFVYPGTALIMIRSLAEHRAAERPHDRTAVVERAGLLGLLFLNNNLHVVHHDHPHIPWYALPAQWRAGRAGVLATWQGPLYQGYRDVARRYAWRPHHSGPHPLFERG